VLLGGNGVAFWNIRSLSANQTNSNYGSNQRRLLSFQGNRIKKRLDVETARKVLCREGSRLLRLCPFVTLGLRIISLKGSVNLKKLNKEQNGTNSERDRYDGK
jgi:hypothetical protein